MAPVIDVHTHMLNHAWLKLLEQHGRPRYTLKAVTGGLRAIHLDGAPFMTPVPPMFDWDLRVANMSKARVDIAVVSLTCPNVFWGGPEVSLKAARHMNDEFAKAQTAHPDRIRWFASLPWQHADLATEELKRAVAKGYTVVPTLSESRAFDGVRTDPAFQELLAQAEAGRQLALAAFRENGGGQLLGS